MPKLCNFKNTLAIAMWDFSYMEMHEKGGAFEDYDKCLDELVDRGYNAVRIDAFPHLIANDFYGNNIETFTKKAGNGGCNNFGFSTWGRKWTIEMNPKKSIVEFIKKCEQRGIWVGLSTWLNDVEEKRCEQVQGVHSLIRIWDETLAFLKENDCLNNIIYVDLLNEYPLWNGFTWLTNTLNTMQYPKDPNASFNKMQQNFYWNTINEALLALHTKWTQFDFLASQTENHWSYMDADKDYSAFNALDVHVWMIHNNEFNAATQYLQSIHGMMDDSDWKEVYAHILNVWNERKDDFITWMEDEMGKIAVVAIKWGLPFGNTEGWGLINCCDHPYLDWQIVKQAGEICADLGVKYGYAFNCTSNFAEPQFGTWNEIEWHKKVTSVIRSGKNAAYKQLNA